MSVCECVVARLLQGLVHSLAVLPTTFARSVRGSSTRSHRHLCPWPTGLAILLSFFHAVVVLFSAASFLWPREQKRVVVDVVVALDCANNSLATHSMVALVQTPMRGVGRKEEISFAGCFDA